MKLSNRIHEYIEFKQSMGMRFNSEAVIICVLTACLAVRVHLPCYALVFISCVNPHWLCFTRPHKPKCLIKLYGITIRR